MRKNQQMYYNNCQRIAFVLTAITCLLLTSYLYRSKSVQNKEIDSLTKSEKSVVNDELKCDLTSIESEKVRCVTTPISRLNQYCSSKVVKGVEGKTFDSSEYWLLSNLVITIRHGDRSPIHSLPGSVPIQTSSSAFLIEPEANEKAKKLNSFKLEFVSKDDKKQMKSNVTVD